MKYYIWAEYLLTYVCDPALNALPISPLLYTHTTVSKYLLYLLLIDYIWFFVYTLEWRQCDTYTSILCVPIHCFYLPLNHLFLSAIVPEQLYCNEKVIFCYKHFDSTRIAGGFYVSNIFHFSEHEKLQCSQQAKAHNKKRLSY